MTQARIAETVTEFLKRRGLALVRRRAVGALGQAEENAAVRELAGQLLAAENTRRDALLGVEADDEITEQVPLEVIAHARALCRDPEGLKTGTIIARVSDPTSASSIEEAVAAVCALPLQS